MPEKLSESVMGVELVFPSDAASTVFQLSEDAVYGAEEVRDETGSDTPQYGKWLRVETNGQEAFLSAPAELRKELVDHGAEPGETYEVTRCEQSGPDPSDPYEVNVEARSEPDQERLSG